MQQSSLAIHVRHLNKQYGTMQALNDFSIDVPNGSVCGLLGPNGAGKTTAVRILSTLLSYDSGHVEIVGLDLKRQASQVRYQIGLLGQHVALDKQLSGRQNLVMFGRLYHLERAAAERRADQLLEQFRLSDASNKSVQDYSGGMRRRLDLAASLIRSPKLLFLDEPTTGLDPRSRNEVWDAVRLLAQQGTTVLLTTQYLEEADQLANQICLIKAGQIIAEGTPDQLKSQLSGERIVLVARHAHDLERLKALVEARLGALAEIQSDTRQLTIAVQERINTLSSLIKLCEEQAIELDDLALRRPTLDEVFLQLTDETPAS
jgi:ABC-2 type transport system ATP-binding protein